MYLNELNLLIDDQKVIGSTLLAANQEFYWVLNLKTLDKTAADYLNYFQEDLFSLTNENQNWYWDKMVANSLYDLNQQDKITIIDENMFKKQPWETGQILKISRNHQENFKLARYLSNFQLNDLIDAIINKLDKSSDFYPIMKDNGEVLKDLILDN